AGRKTKGEEIMFKKYILPIVLVATLMVGNFSIQTVDAAESSQEQQRIQLQTHMKDLLNKLPGEKVDQYVQLFNDLQEQFAQMNMKKVNYKSSFKWFKKEEQSREEESQLENTEEKDQVEDQEKQEEIKQEEPKEEKPQANPRPERPVTPEEPKEEQELVEESQLSEFELEVVELTNNERAKAGLAALEVDEELSRVAREKSRDMSVSGYFDHNSPNYGSPFDMMRSYGVTYQTAGENIAKGQRSPQEVVNAWMNSEGHRANIMNPNFTHIGVGFVETGNHWTQMFIGK